MSDKPKMRVSELEAQILRDVCFSRIKVLHAGPAEAPGDLPLIREMGEVEARQASSVFDFFHCAFSGNEDGLRRQAEKQQAMGPHAGRAYYDGLISDYMDTLNSLMNGKYTSEDIIHLQMRIKGFIKTLKGPKPRNLYIADCHFYHDRICHEMDQRGFADYKAMNAHMIEQWNRKVTPRDDVYILGDFCISRARAVEEILDQLNGKLHLIRGNHDKYLEDRHFDRGLFRSIEDYTEIRDNGRTVILSHYPVFCYKGQYRKDQNGNPLTYMLYGHVHNTHDEELINRFIMETRQTMAWSRYVKAPEPIPCNMINCFCMFSDYLPMTLNEWIQIDKNRRDAMTEKKE